MITVLLKNFLKHHDHFICYHHSPHSQDNTKLRALCNGAIPSLFNDDHHIISFDADILNDGKLMEYIGSMTCPADLITSDGKMNLYDIPFPQIFKIHNPLNQFKTKYFCISNQSKTKAVMPFQ